jgi:RNA polymerase sigma-70 factor (ECF subfamily)
MAAAADPAAPGTGAVVLSLDKTERIEATRPADDLSADFVALYEQNYARLVRALEYSGHSRAAAEDVAQEAFARTLGHWRRVRRGTNPAGYVFTVAFRLARRRRDPVDPDGSASAANAASTPDIAVLTSLRTSVASVIELMPPARRNCAVLCLVVELSPKEAGRILGIAESTVRKQLERARADLKAALET